MSTPERAALTKLRAEGGGDLVLPDEMDAVVVRGAIGIADRVSTFAMKFMLFYFALCAFVLLQMSRVPRCSNEKNNCLSPVLSDRMDFFVVTGIPGSSVFNVSYAACSIPVSKKFDVSMKVWIHPRLVRRANAPVIATVYTRKVQDVCLNASVEDIVATSIEMLRTPLTSVMRTRPRSKARRLLVDDDENDTSDQNDFIPGELRPHWRFAYSPLIIRVLDLGRLARRVAYEGIGPIEVEPLKLSSENEYLPVASIDESSVLKRHALPMSRNESRETMPTLRFKYRPVSALHWGLRNVATQLSLMADTIMPADAADDLRSHMSEERIGRWAASQAVSFLHVNLAWLAFREEIGFYVGRSRFKGVAPSSLIWALLRSLIFFLYLQDANAGLIVLFSAASTVFADYLKLTRVLSLRYLASFPFIHFVPRKRKMAPDVDTSQSLTTRATTAQENEEEEEEEEASDQMTANYDRIAALHVGLSLGPALIGFAIYSLLYDLHTSFYSWLINVLADISYFGGFLSMVPQIYINYKLQSVAHLPIKAFMFKIFQTLIDDVFALIVKAPLKYRLMTLRDDAIFLVFLYQYFRYRTDKSRVNEYGYVYESTTEKQPAEDEVSSSTHPSSHTSLLSKIEDR